MAYNRDNVKKVLADLEKKRRRAISEADARREEIHRVIPEIAGIDHALARTGMKIFETSRLGRDGLEERIGKLRDENENLLAIRRELLKTSGYPEDYTDVKYECPRCGDSGYIDLKMCSCMRLALAEAGYESSGIGHLMQKQSFETFSLSYYAGADKSLMQTTCVRIRAFAENFGTPQAPFQNILMIGATGLGKTHLSTSAAKVVIERGYDVVYETAQNLFSDFEHQKFRASYSDADKTARYFDCDLLIMDDLGTETQNSFTIACLYNIINTRINQSKATIINTNLTNDDLHKRYADRITSRLLGEFVIMQFKGKDIRQQKLMG